MIVLHVLAHDLLHLIYNLVYPAVLGTILYDFIVHWDSGRGGPKRSPSDPPPRDLSEWRATCFALCLLFCMDFMLAKKIYEASAKDFVWWQWILVFPIEILTLWALFRAYYSARHPRSFFRYLLVFAAAGTFFYLIVLQTPICELAIPFAAIGTLATAGCVAKKESFDVWSRLGLGLLLVLIASHYVHSVHSDHAVGTSMSVAGEFPYPDQCKCIK